MSTKIFVNLPTNDLERAKTFYTGLGLELNENFTDDNAACVVVAEDIFLMVLRRDFFQTFTDKEIADPNKVVQTNVALSCDSREEVDAAIERGVAAGGSEPRPAQDLGFMYSRDLEDPDGNNLGFVYMVPEAVEQGPGAFMADEAASE